MLSAPLCDNEESRLDALLRYKVLDTESEGPYDDLVSLAANICDCPIALVSLVDHERQWFKAKIGLDAEHTPRDLAFCAHALLKDEVLIVPNALEDERFFDNPLVTEDPKIRFYAGAPLITHDKYCLGTLCVIDRIPRNLSQQQINSLSILSKQVVSQLELRLNNIQLQALNQEKDNFIRMMSHDLRSVMGIVVSFSRVLQRRFRRLSQEQMEELISKISRNAVQSIGLLDSLISWSQLRQTQRGDCSETIDVAKLCQEVIDHLLDIAKEKSVKIRLSCSTLLAARLEASLLRSVIQNLVHNAIKFSQANSEVNVRISFEQTDLLISVKDQGVGMSDAKSQALFCKKTQTTAGTEGELGSGVGTQLIKEFVDHYGGDITVTSQEGVGTTVSILLPDVIVD